MNKEGGNMGDTYLGECSDCGEETDLIDGICGECYPMDDRKADAGDEEYHKKVNEGGE